MLPFDISSEEEILFYAGHVYSIRVRVQLVRKSVDGRSGGWSGAVGPQRVSGVAMEQAVALALACGLQPRRPLLRWCLRWRHLQPRQTAQQLLAAGVPRGPELGQRLRVLRIETIDALEQKASRLGAHTAARQVLPGSGSITSQKGEVPSAEGRRSITQESSSMTDSQPVLPR